MKILLINPDKFPTNMPSLGLAYIAGSLISAGHEVKIIDTSDSIYQYQEVRKQFLFNLELEAKNFNPSIIGIHFEITNIGFIYKIVNMLRSRLPSSIIVGGGPYSHFLPDEALSRGVHYVIRGEGEIAILELIEYLEGRRSIDQVSGLCTFDKSGKKIQNQIQIIKDIDSLSYPAFDLVNRNLRNLSIKFDYDDWADHFPIASSRGCPFNCIYCTSSGVMSRDFRPRSPESVVAELEYHRKRFGVKKFSFSDDTFGIDRERVINFCEQILKKDLGVSYLARFNITSLDEKIIQLLSKCRFSITMGIESFDRETLRSIRKNQDPDKIIEIIKLLMKYNIPFAFNLLTGFPFEKPEHIETNAQYIRKIAFICHKMRSKMDFSIGLPIPYPGSDLYTLYVDKMHFRDWWVREYIYEYNTPTKTSNQAFYMQKTPEIDPNFVLEHSDRFYDYTKDQVYSLRKSIEQMIWIRGTYEKFRSFKSAARTLITALCFLSERIHRYCPFLERVLFFVPKMLLQLRNGKG